MLMKEVREESTVIAAMLEPVHPILQDALQIIQDHWQRSMHLLASQPAERHPGRTLKMAAVASRCRIGSWASGVRA
ncbi:hypothetical protein LPB72_02405 [Hydrogenophaga crassostreae]|nr:hypothetical protein LPB72_02405 [Hydrogenophaga crassostreae]